MRIAAPPRSHSEEATLAPRRLQRSRKKGARTPQGAIYVGRPTIWGNPFRLDRFGHARSVRLYRRWIECSLGALTLEGLGFEPSEIDSLNRLRSEVLRRLPELVGRNLQCWCPLSTKLCHAEILLEKANSLRDVAAAA